MFRRFQVISLLLLTTGTSYSLTERELWLKDSTRIASFRIEIRKEMPDSQLLTVLFQLTESEKYRVPDSSEAHAKLALKLANRLGDTANINRAIYLIGFAHFKQSELVEARDHYLQCLPYYEQLGDHKRMKSIYYAIGRTSYDRGSYSFALQYFLLSLKASEEMGDSIGIADSYHSIAKIYSSQNDSKQCIAYNNKALGIREAIGYKPGIAASSLNLGIVLMELGKLDDALMYANQAFALRMETNDEKNMAEPYGLLGDIYNKKGEYPNAIIYHNKAIKIWEKHPDSKDDLAENIIGLGNVYVDKLSHDAGIAQYQKALKISEDIGNKNWIKICYEALYRVHKKQEAHASALKYAKLHSELSASLVNEDNRIMLEEMELQNTIALEEKEITLLKKDAALNELRVKKEEDRIQKGKAIVNILLTILLLTFAGGYLVFNNYRLKNRTNLLLTAKNKVIEKHRKNILDSIRYAHRIQNAFFVAVPEIKKHFSDSFVLFKPKDIVSGDFYWLREKDDKVYFAAADCTGHGVRGALVSIICQDLLNHALDHHPNGDPGTLLAWTSQQLMDSLQQRVDPETGEFGVKDGMDIALCCMDRKSQTLSFSGAHARLYMIRDGKLTETRGNNNYIGRVVAGEIYRTHTLPLQKGDRLYLFSDGYADQKGGPNNKKFYYPPFQKQLLDIHQKPMEEQKEALENTLTAWQGANSQVDDILVFGLQIKMG